MMHQVIQNIYFMSEKFIILMQAMKNHHIRKELGLQVLIVFKIQSEPENFEIVSRVISSLLSETTAVVYFMQQSICKKMSESNPNGIYKVFNKKKDVDGLNLVVTVGGDGTILYTAKEFDKLTPPFLTFQKGTLGFLCKFRPQSVESTVQMAVHQLSHKKVRNFSKKSSHHSNHSDHLNSEKSISDTGNESQNQPFQICQLMRLRGIVTNKNKGEKASKVVLNQVAITRKDCNAIALEIFINDQLITTTSGDGILVSTPTGSTAYALSAGGPVVLNGVNSIILVPIAPNSLSFRPICIPSTSVVKLKLSSKSKSYALISFDGQSTIQLAQDDEIRIFHEVGQQNSNLLLFEAKKGMKGENLPTWMQRLKLFLGWNQVFKSPACEIFSKNIDKLQ